MPPRNSQGTGGRSLRPSYLSVAMLTCVAMVSGPLSGCGGEVPTTPAVSKRAFESKNPNGVLGFEAPANDLPWEELDKFPLQKEVDEIFRACERAEDNYRDNSAKFNEQI